MKEFGKWLHDNGIDTSVICEVKAKPVQLETEPEAEDAESPADEEPTTAAKQNMKKVAAKNQPTNTTGAPAAKNISTMETLEKFPAVIDELAEVFGEGFIPDTEMEKDDFNGLFYKTSTNRNTGKVTRNLCVAVGSKAAQIIETQLDGTYTPSGANWIFTLPSGAVLKVHQSAKKKGFKYITNTTAFQESVFALLMQYSVEGKEIPMSLNKDYAKYKVMGWMMESDIAKKTGIWKFLNYNVPADDVETFYNEVETVLTSNQNGWRNSFEAVSKIDWKAKINELYNVSKDADGKQITPPAWTSPLFVHDNLKLKAGAGLKQKVERFLRGNRCGVPKDEVDKTDVLLIFDTNSVNQVLDKILSFKSGEEEAHNKYINELINGGVLLGISLKQTGTNVNVAAVNFNISTTAVGDNIKDDNKVLVKFDPKNPKNSTLDNAHAVKPAFKPGIVTYKVSIPFNEGHAVDMHAQHENDPTVDALIRVSGGQVQVNFGIGSRVFLGKGNDALKGSEELMKNFKYSGVNATQLYKQTMGDANDRISSSKAIYKVVETIYHAIVSNPAAFAQVFTKAIGYPLAIVRGKKMDYKIVSTPYVKIY